MLERIFHRDSQEPKPYSPLALEPDFDTETAQYVRLMEDELIRLGHMTEADRMRIPEEIEHPSGK